MNSLLSSFFDQYGLIIMLLVIFAAFMIYYYMRNASYKKQEDQFQKMLKVGDKVKTYSGFYGEVAKITNTTDGIVISLKLGENTVIDVDIRAIMLQLDTKTEIEPTVADKIAEMRDKESLEKESQKAVQTEQKDSAKNETNSKPQDAQPVAKAEPEVVAKSAEKQEKSKQKENKKKTK